MEYLTTRKAAGIARDLIDKSEMSKAKIAKAAGMSRQWLDRSLDEDHPFIIKRVLQAMGHKAGVAIAFEENKEVSE